MPTNDNDKNDHMTAPLTRRDLNEALENFATKYDLENVATKDDLKNFVTKDDLENFAIKYDLKNVATKHDLRNEISSALRIVSEENRAWFRTIDDQYKDLPGRVRKLEEAVFPPPPRARRKKAG